MARPTRDDTVRALLDLHGRTYAEEASISLADKPSPLYRLLVLSLLLSARISSGIAVAAARSLSRAGMRTAAAMLDATWQDRVDALSAAGYRRFDERTATMLGTGAELLLAEWGGDLRRLRDEVVAGGDAADRVAAVRAALERLPGIGPVGSAVFCREVQGVWPELAPFLDQRVLDGARSLGLPTSARGLAGLVPELVAPQDLPRLAAACVRATLDDDVVATTREAARQAARS